MENNPILPPVPNRNPRPTLLTVLCILTFVGSGMMGFSSLMGFLFFDTFKSMAPEIAKIWKQPAMAEMFDAVSPPFFLASSAIYLLSLAGAIQMWRLRKRGFHIYTVAQILLILAPMYFFRLPGPSVPDILISGTFVYLYGRHLKLMA